MNLPAGMESRNQQTLPSALGKVLKLMIPTPSSLSLSLSQPHTHTRTPLISYPQACWWAIEAQPVFSYNKLCVHYWCSFWCSQKLTATSLRSESKIDKLINKHAGMRFICFSLLNEKQLATSGLCFWGKDEKAGIINTWAPGKTCVCVYSYAWASLSLLTDRVEMPRARSGSLWIRNN